MPRRSLNSKHRDGPNPTTIYRTFPRNTNRKAASSVPGSSAKEAAKRQIEDMVKKQLGVMHWLHDIDYLESLELCIKAEH